jgi:hypothetical protein
MGLRLAMSALVIPIVAWLQKPNKENEDQLREAHDAFAEVMRVAPDQGMLLAVENGVKVLQRAMKHLQAGQSVELLPTNVELGTEDGKRTVKISCGKSFVVLAQVECDEPGGLAINSIHEEGDKDSDEFRNLKVTFMAICEPLKVFLTGTDEEAKLAGDELEISAEGWNALKEEQPDMAAQMAPGILKGEVRLGTMPVDVSQEEAQALIKRFEDGEMSMEDLRRKLGVSGTLH